MSLEPSNLEQITPLLSLGFLTFEKHNNIPVYLLQYGCEGQMRHVNAICKIHMLSNLNHFNYY